MNDTTPISIDLYETPAVLASFDAREVLGTANAFVGGGSTVST